MSWWLKARRAHTVLPAGLALFAVTLLVFQDAVVELPSFLTSSATPVLFVLMAPVPLCATLLLSLESRLASAEDTGIRRLPALDAALTAGTVGAAVAVGWAIGVVLDSSVPPAAGRNAAFLVGLMLCLRVVAGPPAVMAPVVWIFAVIFLGFGESNRPHFWTVLPQPADHPYAAVAAVTALAAGLMLQAASRLGAFTSVFPDRSEAG